MFYSKTFRSSFNSLTSYLIAIVLFIGCKPDIKETSASEKYFDIAGYFKRDTAKLNHLQLSVLKSVTHNNNTEIKTVQIKDWGRELDFFINSDINKPAWRDSYSITANNDFLLYKARDPELKVREMLIKKSGSTVKWILIYNRTSNKLYRSLEKLTYYPDSLYIIEKSQSVRFLGTNNYKIQGSIRK